MRLFADRMKKKELRLPKLPFSAQNGNKDYNTGNLFLFVKSGPLTLMKSGFWKFIQKAFKSEAFCLVFSY